MPISIRHQYDGLQDQISDETGLKCLDPSRTKQSFKDDSDINNITKRYERTGQLPDLIKVEPRYGDFSDVPSYQESLHIVNHANEQFHALDAHLRSRFNNDPSEFLAFATNPASLAEMVKLGLAVEKPQDPTPSPAAPGVAPGKAPS